MPIYNLTAHNGSRLEDDGGPELPNDAAARAYALLQVVRQLNRNNGNRCNHWKWKSPRATGRSLTSRSAARLSNRPAMNRAAPSWPSPMPSCH
jgi:hypothetical protein